MGEKEIQQLPPSHTLYTREKKLPTYMSAF
jgi:hypothetical protein